MNPFRKKMLALGIILFIFCLGEVVVGFTGNYLGILSHSLKPSFALGIVGTFYCLSGVFLLVTKKKWGAVCCMVFILAEILGRIYLVETGEAPSSGKDFLKIIIGGIIALGFIAYIGSNWKSFE